MNVRITRSDIVQWRNEPVGTVERPSSVGYGAPWTFYPDPECQQWAKGTPISHTSYHDFRDKLRLHFLKIERELKAS